MKRLNTGIFIKRASQIHDNFYDYSKVVYVNEITLIEIICPKHGTFFQKPISHLTGRGCKICGKNRKKGLIRGVAINDTEYTRSDEGMKHWYDLLRRCFPVTEHEKKQCRSYADVIFYKPWLKFSNFKKWFDQHHIEGYVLDKDLLSKQIKMYSPETCCFIPKELNNIIQTQHKTNRKIDGKRFYNKSKGVFQPKMCVNGKTKSFGTCTTENEAIVIYKSKKKEYINKKAKEYFCKGLISDKIYKAFLKFKVTYE